MMKRPAPTFVTLRAFGLFAAIAVLLGLYYWVHKPFDTVSGRLIAGALLDLLTAALLVTLAGGVSFSLAMPSSAQVFTLLRT